MKKAWLVRPIPHGINRVSEFKNEGIVAVGWPLIGDLAKKSREELKQLLSKKPYALDGLALGNAYATIDIFVNQIEIGDLVLMPDGEDIYFGEIASDYYFDSAIKSQNGGYPHQRTVNWLSNTSRKSLSMNLRRSLKAHRTTANLSHHAKEIEALCRGEKIAETEFPQSSTISVSYPLRPDFTISFEIPYDITSDEAKRLGTYFTSLYFKE
jgi:Uncharacterized conserved protein